VPVQADSAGQRHCAVSSRVLGCRFVLRPPSTDRAPRPCPGARFHNRRGGGDGRRDSGFRVRWSRRPCRV